MGVNWGTGLIRWKPHSGLDGRTYSLVHLHPFQFTCELKASGIHRARTITINVGFALHVFTCDFAYAGDCPEEYRDDRERRAFDYERYHASLHLRELLRTLERRRCFFAKHENFFTADLECAPEGHEYRVFFNVRRDKSNADSVTLIVQSAYLARIKVAPSSVRRQAVGFRVILSKTLLSKSLREQP